MPFPWYSLLLALAFSVFSCAPSLAQDVPASPCADSLYQALRSKPLEGLSEREYEYFMQREKACTDHQRLTALVTQPGSPAPRQSERPLASETRTRDNSNNGVDVYVRNTSDRPIIVNSLRVSECQNVRLTSCGIHFPKMLIQPGSERRVYTIRFVSENQPTSYRYNYHISEVTP